MHRLLLLAVLLPLSALAQDASGTVRRWSESQALTRPAPTASCLASVSPEGMDLRYVRGYRVSVAAESGQTLSGTGTLRAYHYDFTLGSWARTPALDVTLSTSGVRTIWLPDAATLVRSGSVLDAADTVGVSGGTTVTLRITAWTGGA